MAHIPFASCNLVMSALYVALLFVIMKVNTRAYLSGLPQSRRVSTNPAPESSIEEDPSV